MTRRLFAGMAAVAFVLVACAPPAAPALTDPKEILTKSVETLGAVKSFHLDAQVTGSFSADLMNTGTPTSFDLTGTNATMDVDIAAKKAKATFAVPALLGLSGELIQIDQTSYFKSTLTGPQYQKQAASSAGIPSEATDPAAAIAAFRSGLDAPGIDPTKLADVKCGQKDCYAVQVDLTAEELQALASAEPVAGLEAGSLTILTAVEKDTLRPASLTVTVDAGTSGNLVVTLTFTNWDVPVTVTEPPADQIAPG